MTARILIFRHRSAFVAMGLDAPVAGRGSSLFEALASLDSSPDVYEHSRIVFADLGHPSWENAIPLGEHQCGEVRMVASPP